MHKWEETKIKDLFFCKCGLYRYPVRKRKSFKARLEAINSVVNSNPVHSLYIYSPSHYVKIKSTVSFRWYSFYHEECKLKHDA